jgi:hypothetical protein
MKKILVELNITQSYKAQVLVSGEFTGENDPAIMKVAEEEADAMDHGNWGYENTEFELMNAKEIPNHLSPFHHDLLKMGYSLKKIENYSEEDAEAEVDAIRS